MNHDELVARVNKLRKSLKKLSNDPTVEEVHDLRTRARRVESLMESLQLNTSSDERRLLRDLKRVRTGAGDVRDMDVLTSNLVGSCDVEEDENDCLVRLLHHLGYQRHREARKLHKTVRRKASALRSALKREARKLDSEVTSFTAGAATPDKKGFAEDGAPLHAVSVALVMGRQLASVKRLGANNLHPYRIEVKRLRYTLQMAEEAGANDQFVKALGEVQDSIGEWHDWLQLREIAARVLRHDDCKLLRLTDHVVEERLQTALQVTEKMRRRYLLPESTGTAAKRKSAKTKKPALAEPVLIAASRIAA